MAVMLVIGAGLLVKSLLRLEQVNPGFNPERVLTFKTGLPGARYPEDAQVLKTFQEIQRRLESNPQVLAVGATSTAALHGTTWTGDATVEGRTGDDYERELRRRAHSFPELVALFGENVVVFDRIWYGLHQVDGEQVSRFAANIEKLKA